MGSRRDSVSSIESADSDIIMNPEGRVLNDAIVEWRDYHGNGRNVVALKLLEIFMQLTERRAQMNPAEVESFRLYPDFVLMEAVLHNCLQYVCHVTEHLKMIIAIYLFIILYFIVPG